MSAGTMLKLAALNATLFASACASLATAESNAVIVAPTPESRAELREAVARALQRTDVALADDALTKTSVLLIERQPARDSSGQRLSGRDLERPEEFRLLVNGASCVLLHQRTGERFELKRTRCTAESR